MIEYTANVISEYDPVFVPDHVSLWKPENVEGGYIVNLWAVNEGHAETTIFAMFPQAVIDDGPHEVFCPTSVSDDWCPRECADLGEDISDPVIVVAGWFVVPGAHWYADVIDVEPLED